MTLRRLSLPIILCASLAIGLSCRKQETEIIQQTKKENHSSSFRTTGSTTAKTIKFTIKASAHNENTAKVWLDTVGKTTIDQTLGNNYPVWRYDLCSSIKKTGYLSSYTNWGILISDEEAQKFFKEHLLSKEKSNLNDARISSVTVYVADADGTVKQQLQGKTVQIGEEFQQEFEVPINQNIVVTIQASQENRNFFNSYSVKQVASLYKGSSREFRDNVTGKIAENTTVYLSADLIKDGKQIDHKSEYHETEVSTTFTFTN